MDVGGLSRFNDEFVDSSWKSEFECDIAMLGRALIHNVVIVSLHFESFYKDCDTLYKKKQG